MLLSRYHRNDAEGYCLPEGQYFPDKDFIRKENRYLSVQEAFLWLISI